MNKNENLMTVEEVEEYLKLSESTIRKRIQNQSIPFVKIGGSIRFRKQDIDAWLEKIIDAQKRAT